MAETLPSPVLLVLGISLFSAGLLALPWLFGTISMVRYIYPVLALVIGLVLYRTFPILFVGYAWWLWFLSAFVARVVDYYVGVYQRPNLIMLTPYLVSGLGFLALFRHRNRLLDADYFPFVLVLAGIIYAYAIGILRNGLFQASYGLVQWIVPVCFGLYVALYWRDYPAMRQSVRRTFLWGVAVMGIYGIIQFTVLPPWDSFWMNEVPTGRFMRISRPFELRIFSTMFTVNHFSTIMMVGLLILFSTSTWKHLSIALPGYASFLLTFVRSAWGAWLVALVLMAIWLKGPMRTRLVGMLVLGMLTVLPLLSVPRISNRLSTRVETLQNLEDDGSMRTRTRLYQEIYLHALTNPIGEGLTNREITSDSGLLTIPYHLGWPGLLLFAMGLMLLVRRLWQGRRLTRDPFAAISMAIAFAILALLVFKNSLNGAMGATFWCFAGLALASYRYHEAQENDEDGLEPEPSNEQEIP